MKAFRSISVERAGCILRAPKLKTGFSPAACLTRDAAVAIPDAWQIVPSIAVSSSQKAPYGPSMEKTVSKGKKRLPSSIASTSTSVPASSDSISSIPERTAYP